MNNNPYQYHQDKNISFAVSSLLNMKVLQSEKHTRKVIEDDKKNKFQALRSVHNLSYDQAKEVYKTYQMVQLTLLAAEDN